MKGIFEIKEYELVPTTQIFPLYNYKREKIGDNYISWSLRRIYCCHERIFKTTKEIVVNEDLYRLQIGDKYLLKELGKVVRITDKVMIDDKTFRFGISYTINTECENYKEKREELEQYIRDCEEKENREGREKALLELQKRKEESEGCIKKFFKKLLK